MSEGPGAGMQQEAEVVVRTQLARGLPVPPDPAGGRAEEADRAVLDAEHEPVPQAHRPDAGVQRDVLEDALLARLAADARRLAVDIVWVQLERHETQRLEAERIADRHVVGGLERRARDVGSRAPPEVGRAATDCGTNWVTHAVLVQLACQ